MQIKEFELQRRSSIDASSTCRLKGTVRAWRRLKCRGLNGQFSPSEYRVLGTIHSVHGAVPTTLKANSSVALSADRQNTTKLPRVEPGQEN